MPNHFCRYLSNGYSFSIARSGLTLVSPCCWFKQSVPLDSYLGNNRKIHFESITDWTPACEACKVLEDAGQKSLRQAGEDWITDQHHDQDAATIDIHLDSECNAACVICDEYSSSLWAKENAKIAGKTIKIQNSSNAIDKSIADIVANVPLEKVSYVKFFGGEPLFTDTHLKFLKQLPYPEQVTLHYTTNGSIYPNDQVLAAWKKFKTVIFAISVDGINQQFDYIRWPLPWDKVSKNILRIKENKEIWNLIFRVEFTVNWLNAYYYDTVASWVDLNLSTNLYGDKTEINVHTCTRSVWSTELMPYNIRKLVMNKYPNDHVIHNLVKNLPAPGSLNEWKQFVQTWDQRRGHSWQQAFPDLEKHV